MSGVASTATAARPPLVSHSSARFCPPRARRILIDCTATQHCDLGGGIQRLVRNLVNSAGPLGKAVGVPCQGVMCDAASRLVAIHSLPSPAGPVRAATPVDNAAAAPRRDAVAPMHLRSLLAGSVRHTLATVGMLEPALKLRRMVRRRAIESLPAPLVHAPAEIEPGPGDVLLLPDSTWSTPQLWECAVRAKRQGAKVGAVIYDLIPLRSPQYCGSAFLDTFRPWWDLVRRELDFVVCISRSVWEDVQNYMAGHPDGTATPPLRGAAFRLGAGLDLNCDHSETRPQLRELFAGRVLENPYLLAASFHERKNHQVVLEAFEKLWARGLPLRLVMIARIYGGHLPPLAVQLERHPEWNRRLFWFHDVEDSELDFSYRRAAALIAPSCAEGFDLPVVESLSRGRPVLASDIPVHREVGGPHAAYFPASSADALAELIIRHHAGGLSRAIAPLDGFRWPNWFDSGRELLEQVVDLYADRGDCRQAGHEDAYPASAL